MDVIVAIAKLVPVLTANATNDAPHPTKQSLNADVAKNKNHQLEVDDLLTNKCVSQYYEK